MGISRDANILNLARRCVAEKMIGKVACFCLILLIFLKKTNF